MKVISSMMHPLYRISTAVEDGQELQLRWQNSSSSDEDCDYHYGNIECIYNESDVMTTTKSSPTSSLSGATISTCDSSSSVTTSSSTSQYTTESSSHLQSNLCPVTGHYSNFYDHYYIPTSSAIGVGQYGKVQSCVNIATGKTYAVKTIQKSQLDQRLDHIQREIHMLTKVTSHPNILKLVDYHEDEEYVHIVTEKYNGGELFDLIGESTSNTGCLTEGCAASIIKSVLEALEYLHSMDIVHRDVKPENILFESERDEDSYCYDHLTSSNSIRLIDFGLSREHNVLVDGYMSNPVGSAYYMAPEVLNGKYTKSCDVWSVGIVTYILLCGYPPFNGKNEDEIKQTVMDHGSEKNVNFKLRGWAGKSEEAKDFIKCLLRRDPSKRFTAKEAMMHPFLQMYC